MSEIAKSNTELKQIWVSMFCARNYDGLGAYDERFLPLSLLIKALQIQLEGT